MSFTVIDVPQRSLEWAAARLGRLTSSRAADMCAQGRGSAESAGRRNLRVQLVLERITRRPQEKGFQSAAMAQGIEREPDAFLAYEALTGRFLNRTGFLQHSTLMVGCSLDGHHGDFEGITEIKSPIPATHLEYLRTGKVPADYMRQIEHALWVSGADWCDWLSYNPDFPDDLQVKLVRVPRDEAAIREYAAKAELFLDEVDREVQALATMTNLPGVLRLVVGATA